MTAEQKHEARYSVFVSLFLGVILFLFSQSCRLEDQYTPTPIEVRGSSTASEAFNLATAKASTLKGTIVHADYNTGSMAPLVDRDGFIVVSPVPYDEIKKRQLLWAVSFWGGTYVHVAVEKDAGGWITSGLANDRSDAGWRVTPERYLGVVVAYFPYGAPVVHSFKSRPR